MSPRTTLTSPDELAPAWRLTVYLDGDDDARTATGNVEMLLGRALEAMEAGRAIVGYTLERDEGAAPDHAGRIGYIDDLCLCGHPFSLHRKPGLDCCASVADGSRGLTECRCSGFVAEVAP